MARSGNAAGTGGNGRNGGFLFGLDLKERLIAALLAVILGGGGAAGYIGFNPPRPDPFTGTMGRDMEKRMVAYCDKRVGTVRTELKDHDDSSDKYRHLITSNVTRIRHLERDMSRLERIISQHGRGALE